MGLFGVTCNSLIIYAFKKDKASRSSFNLICLFRACINLYVLITTFLIYFLPTAFLGYSLYNPVVEAFLIIFSNTFYLGNEYQTILVAVNRFCALFKPLYYSKFFGFRPTLVALCMIYGYRFVSLFIQSFFYFKEDTPTDVQCFIFFSPEKLSWTLTEDPACSEDDNILLVVSITFVTVLCLNIAIFTKIILYQKSTAREGRRITSAERRNIMLFLQTVLQDSLYVIDLTFTFKLSGLSNARLWTFISGTLVWESLHSLDGFIMILFNERLSFLRSLFRSTPSFPVSETAPSAVTPLPRID
ncbi:unnamed protein product [Caenorhabditis sp. 36 PRJEB53466]|nr:unnamed protein product [Caenorhabditis sp. 36 PRJEB53466]